MAQFKFLRPLVTVLVNRSGIGKASVWHAVIVTFMHYFSWGLLTVPFIEKLSGSFGNRVLLVDGLVYGVRGILGFVTTPVMGAISDFRGRKVVMLLAVATTYAPIPFMMLKSWWFFAILTVSSICGSTYSASLAYVADTTSVENRSKGYGIIAASFGAGIAFSPSLGVDSTAPVYLKTNMGFEYEEVSMMLGLLSVLAITSNLLLGYIMNVVGVKGSIRLGLLLLLLQLFFFGCGTHHWMYWLSSILAALATIIPAANNAVASIYASPENRGAVLGIISGIECLSEGLGPAFFGVLFFIFQDDDLKVNSPIPMPFVISAISVFVAIVLTGFIKKETIEKEPLIYKIIDDATEDELEPLAKTTFKYEKNNGYVKLEIDDNYDSDCKERSFK
ncbi:GD14894 [Drosophila simulans]|uniref:GD14894 n=1 Tax=Drosophila simulans TaxID=7240 RepID=B4QJ38_DROSI|nr:GD14894 [Drosophila simulans]